MLRMSLIYDCKSLILIEPNNELLIIIPKPIIKDRKKIENESNSINLNKKHRKLF